MPEHTLHIDLESRSAVDLKRAGVYVYAADPSTDVWCAAYAVDDGPVNLWLPGSMLPTPISDAVTYGWPIMAHNAAFERTMWRHILTPRYGWPEPRLEQWRCTMAMALAMSLPASLENCAAALGLDVGKDMDGHNVMMRMAKPRRPRKGEDPNGVYWFDDDERKQKLYAYCRHDVVVERAIEKRLLKLRPFEQRLCHLDQRINDRGVNVDVELCQAAMRVVSTATKWLNDEIYAITGGSVSATTNVGQISAWVRERGWPMDSLDKTHIDDALVRADLPPDVRRVLELRREAAKASVKKIDALLAGRSSDGRARGLLQYHAASTGRWAGRRFQPQNIKRPDLEDVDSAIEAVATGNAAYVATLYGEPLAVVGDCLRGMVCAGDGKALIAADFANIEGRVLAWLAGEAWKVEAFRAFDAGRGPDLYKLAYSRSFGIRPEEVDKDQRQIGKVMELALGYQGGVGAFQTMAAAYRVEVSDDKADELKIAWRQAHPHIKAFWYDLENAAVRAVEDPGNVYEVGKLSFRRSGSFLWLRLPSGRTLCYPYPRVEMRTVPWLNEDPEWVSCDSREEANFLYGSDVAWSAERKAVYIRTQAKKPAVIYKGVDSYTRKWGDCITYGGLWAENVTQAVARDILAEAMVRAEAAGYEIILTVHDEVVAERRTVDLSEFVRIMTYIPTWAEGLPVAAEAWTGRRYRK